MGTVAIEMAANPTALKETHSGSNGKSVASSRPKKVSGAVAKAARGRRVAGAPKPPSTYEVSAHPGPGNAIPAELGEAAIDLQKAFGGKSVWFLIQNNGGGPRYDELDESVRQAFFKARTDLRSCSSPLLVVDSPGGYAQAAYQIASLFRRHCGGFVAVVPRYAKSAATLLILGATDIYMGFDAEIGPLDAQLMDPDREEYGSALNEVQALERLHSSALEEIDRTMALMLGRTGKKIDSILPLVLDYWAKVMRPLLEKIDTVHLTQQSRILKVAEDYAVRLLATKYGQFRAQMIASHLVNHYSEHRFVIDRDEAGGPNLLDLPVATPEQESAITRLEHWLTFNTITTLGQVKEVTR
jgi:hypothetical protein